MQYCRCSNVVKMTSDRDQILEGGDGIGTETEMQRGSIATKFLNNAAGCCTAVYFCCLNWDLLHNANDNAQHTNTMFNVVFVCTAIKFESGK